MGNQTFTIRGDQWGSFSGSGFTGNGTQAVLTLSGVAAHGSSADLYTVEVAQINSGIDAIQNGQFVTVYDAQGNKVAGPINAQPDEYQGRASGDEYLVMSSAHLVIDLRGLPASGGTLVLDEAARTGDPLIGDNDGNLDFTDIRADFPCFALGARILTGTGWRAAETLVPGDLVVTADRGLQPVVWARSREIGAAAALRQPPVRIAPGGLPGGSPARPLTLSPRHGVHLGPAGSGVLVPAKALTGRPGIGCPDCSRGIAYVSILLPRHHLIWAEGLLCESFYPGDWIISALPAPLRSELETLLPGLGHAGAEAVYGPTCRPRLGVRAARRWLAGIWHDRTRPRRRPHAIVHS